MLPHVLDEVSAQRKLCQQTVHVLEPRPPKSFEDEDDDEYEDEARYTFARPLSLHELRRQTQRFG